MSAIDTLFQELRASGRKALIPFVTAGDPDLEFTAELLREFAARGCAMCELGIPYSDPIADGPVIQASYTRALERRIRLSHIFEMTSQTVPNLPIPTVMMVSYAIVYRYGPERFVQRAKQAGVAGAIVPDLLFEEADELANCCAREDFSLIQLVTPTTPRERAVRIAESATGFLYFVSVSGITGERNQLPTELKENVAWLRSQTDLPICVGFGISQPSQVQLLAPVVDGLIVGSAIVRRVAEAAGQPRQEVIGGIGQYVEKLVGAFDL